MALTDSLIYSYELDEASGNALDAHASLTATDNNTVGSGTGHVNATARDFEVGNSEYFERASETALQAGDIACAWEAWVNRESGGASRTVFGKSSGGNLEYDLQATTGFNFRASSSSGFGGLTTCGATTFGVPSDATWYQIIAQHDPTANQLSIRVNNGAIDTVSFTGGIYVTTDSFRIGANAFGEYWDGLLGPIRYWKKNLTEDEQDELWNGGAGLPYASLGGGGGNPILPSPFVVRSQAVNRASFY